MKSVEERIMRRWLVPVLWAVLGAVVVVVVLVASPTAREVSAESARVVFQVVTSPFILESSLALLGLCIVIMINQRRIQKEGDGWVYLQVKDSAPETESKADDPPHRHDAVIWLEKPAPFDQAAAGFDVVEGYLDLGLPEEALSEIDAWPSEARRGERAALLQLRGQVMAGREGAAAFAEKAVRDHPKSVAAIVGAGLCGAGWVCEKSPTENGEAKNLPGRLAALLEVLQRLHPPSFDALPAEHPVRRLLSR